MFLLPDSVPCTPAHGTEPVGTGHQSWRLQRHYHPGANTEGYPSALPLPTASGRVPLGLLGAGRVVMDEDGAWSSE